LEITTLSKAVTDLANSLITASVGLVPKILGAIVAYIVGGYVINKLMAIVNKALRLRNYDPSLQSFLHSLVKSLLTIFLLLTVFGILGFNLTSFAAILAGLAVGVGSALNGTLGNFAGGVMMLIFKPFKIGDKIDSQGYSGQVKEQNIFNTILLTHEGKTVILANGPLSTGTIVNHTTHGVSKSEIRITLGHDQDLLNTRKLILQSITSVPNILQDPSPFVSNEGFNENGILIGIHFYTQNSIAEVTKSAVVNEINNLFQREKISILPNK
jgi:small conductance mechanosensitive channel